MFVRFASTVAALVLLSASAHALQLGARIELVTNGTPTCVAVGDVDGDGRDDVVLGVSSPPALAVFPGTGLGTFGSRTDYAMRGQPTAVRVADVNGDGIRDLVATCSPQWVCVVPGAGGGVFGARLDFGVSSGPVALDIGDLNGDGRRDIVAACPLATCVSVLLANSSGGFGTRTNFTTGAMPAGVAIALVTADARPDLLVTSSGADVMTVLENTGAGRFEFWQDFPTGHFPHGIAAADFDADGRADAAVTESGAGTVRLLMGDAAAGFVPGPQLASGATPEGIATGDVDGDGKLDLAVTHRGNNTVTIFFGDGAGAFGTRTDAAVGIAPVGVALGRFDADTLVDIATAGTGNPYGVVLRWATGTTTTLASSANPVAIADTLTLTATVSPPAATGQVRFLEGVNVLGAADLVGGQAKLRIATLPLGTHLIVASYTGGPLHAASQSAALVQQVALQATSITLNTSPNPSAVQATVNLTAVVTPSTARGLVEFRDGTLRMGQAFLGGGVATVALPFTTVGTHTLTAVYAGDAPYAPSTSPPVQQQVNPANGVTLTATPNPAAPGQPISLTATLMPSDATGTVTFWWGTTSLGVEALAAGVATHVVASFPLGSHVLTAAYSGDATHPASTSPPITLVVRLAPTITTLQLGAPDAVAGSPVWFRARVNPVPPDTVRPTGTVQFRVDGAAFGAPIALPSDTSWVTSDTTRTLTLGTHTVTAVYGGNARFAGSTSAPSTQTVRTRDEARILHVTDVPNDQGRFVRLVVAPSGQDAAEAATPIVRYEVFRRIDDSAASRAPGAEPAAARLAGWDAVGSMGAYTDTLYNIVVPTLADSNVAGLRWSVFFVRAATAAPRTYYDSAPDSGWSRDDLAPATPVALHAELGANGVRLHWPAASEPDADHYCVWRGDRADFGVDDAHRVATPSDTAWVDPAGEGWYRVAAVDVNGNASAPSPAVAALGATGATFALDAPSPNPGRGDGLSVRFALRASTAARLELLDVTGRRVLTREVGALGPGWHRVNLAAGRRLAPGIYHLRLVQAGETRRVRWVVLE